MEQHIENTTNAPAPAGTRLTFAELEQTLGALDTAGKVAHLNHNDKFNHLEENEEHPELGRHMPGSMPNECGVCAEVVYSFDKFMLMTKQYFGVSGVPLSEIITQMRMIRAIMRMVEEEKNGNSK